MTSSSPLPSSTARTTYLRVKRHRQVEPVASLCVELHGKRARSHQDVLHLAHALQSSNGLSESSSAHPPLPSPQRPDCAIWKRVEQEGESLDRNKKRVVEAVLQEDEPTSRDETDSAAPRQRKRRRLALTLVPAEAIAPPPAKVEETTRKNLVLDPLTRRVDQSLFRVVQGNVSVSQHVDYCTDDELLSRGGEVRRWLSNCNVRVGNILHLAALQGDVEGALTVLQWEIPSLKKTLDGDQRTPYQVAKLAGHDQIAELLQETGRLDEKEEDYVYDVFCLQTNESSSLPASPQQAPQEEEEDAVVELRGGVGYWNEEGDLVLEAQESIGDALEEENDDDIDSNDEDHEGNDYPEDQDGEIWDDDSDDSMDAGFRHLPVYPNSDCKFMGGGGYDVDYLGDDDDEYDTQYGPYDPMYTATKERLYAYDEELDDEDR